MNIAALHLEVARSNARAARLYAAAGFEARSQYHLMTRRLTE
ncbi:MAG: ribosomal protein S18 acetylase RimI-like enzyme [Gammaproteobacteria bacterium]|jgi:ribosomal protein S18 acetylase RimI-like enzyme